MTAHWGLPDPAAVKGSEDEVRMAFRDATVTMKRRIDLMLALPLSSLGAMAIQRHVRDTAVPRCPPRRRHGRRLAGTRDV
jgi:arsenate reductase